jgi:ribosomal protein S18 acetylase RimI-like enzyme
MSPDALRIATIDLERDARTCVAFHRDMYVTSFGTEAGLDAEMGEQAATYLAQLRERILRVPEGNTHLWEGARIVGQTEVRLLDEERDVGYVSLFYVVPERRGRGLARVLHEHVAAVFRGRGMRTLRLSVCPVNPHAIACYRKLGWVRVGERAHPVHTMDVMEYTL